MTPIGPGTWPAVQGAVEYLRDQGTSDVAILDVDAHHGNGAHSIFWERADVFTASVHADQGEGWFPHFLGFANERGAGDGEGANMNLPLAPDRERTNGPQPSRG